ncbi:MAG: DUF2162 domain-containing protein [Desulfobacterales bacterium]|nr:DUF2162 domain-containing protein [Desulfobacterales bacterium]
MELKTLVLGIFMSTAAFALKSGGGLAYLFIKSPGGLKRLKLSLLFALGYGLVFGGAALLIHHIDLTAHLDLLQAFFKSGMTIHFVLAGLLLVWGIGLLRKDHGTGEKRSRTWMALVIPCPVCFSVILLSMGFVTALYPDAPLVGLTLYLGFISVSLIAAFGGAWLARGNGAEGFAEQSLGALMLYLAVYFLLSVIVVPQFSDLDRIYRISLSDVPVSLTADKAWVTGIALTALAIGFFKPFSHINHPFKRNV